MRWIDTRYQTGTWQMVNHFKSHLKPKLALQSNYPCKLKNSSEEITRIHEENRLNCKEVTRYRYCNRYINTAISNDRLKPTRGAEASSWQGDSSCALNSLSRSWSLIGESGPTCQKEALGCIKLARVSKHGNRSDDCANKILEQIYESWCGV